MGRSTETKQSDAIARLDAGHTQAAKTNNARAQQRGSVQIVELIGKRKSEIGANGRIFRVPAVRAIPSKGGRIAEILQAKLTIPARAVDSANPGNAHPCADSEFLGSAGRMSAYYFADNLMSRDYSRATGWQFAFDDMQISAADSTGTHPQENLTGLRFRPRHLANPKRPLPNFLRRG
jgi:hypothetical protein